MERGFEVLGELIDKAYSFSEELALCRERLWTASLFKRAWDHFRAKLG